MSAMTGPPIWLWICGTKEAEVQVFHYTHKRMFTDLYKIRYAGY
jgi:hypothetical protein